MRQTRQKIIARDYYASRKMRLSLAVASALLGTSASWAMTAVDDTALAGVTGQDGLTVTMNSASQIGGPSSVAKWNPDGLGNAASAAILLDGLQFNSIGADGAAAANSNFQVNTNLNVGTDSSGNSEINVGMSWTRMRELIPGVYMANGSSGTMLQSSYSLGSMVLDSNGSFVMSNSGTGLLSGGSVSSNGGTPVFNGVAGRQLELTLGTPQFDISSPAGPSAQLYYRQGGAGSPELVMDKLYLQMGFPASTGGVIGACSSASSCGSFVPGSSGLYVGAPTLNFNFNYRLDYIATPPSGSSYTTVGMAPYTQSLAYTGWTGNFNNAELLMSGGGVWSGQSTYNPNVPSGRNQGMNFAFHADYAPDFTWLMGLGTGSEILKFSDWTKLTGAQWALNAPNVTLDVVNPGQGPGGLCWGNTVYGTNAGACMTSFKRVYDNLQITPQYLDVTPGLGAANATALGVVFRNVSLQAYAQKVVLLDDANNTGSYTGAVTAANGHVVPKTRSEGWGLIYTFGALDGNVYLYPGDYAPGSSTPSGDGVTLDVLLMSQSTANNPNKLLGNTNFMIADTTKGYGIGLLQANLLFGAHQLDFNMLPTGINLVTNDMRAEINGRLGGGSVPSMTAVINIGNIDVNLEGGINLLITGETTKTQSQDTATNNQYALYVPGSSPLSATGATVDKYIYSNPYSSGAGYNYLGFSGTMTLGSSATFGKGCSDPSAMGVGCTDSYISLGEPSQPGVDVRFADLQGTLRILNGRIFLASAGDPVMGGPNSLPGLQIAADVQVGSTAGGQALATNVMLGTQNSSGSFSGNYAALGSIVMPSGQMYSSIVLKPQH